LDTYEIYVNGMSTSMPIDVQTRRMVASVPGLEDAEMIRPGYAIEYDAIDPGNLSSFAWKLSRSKVLFLAGQINGTSGYEEAACQGLIAGLNAARKVGGIESRSWLDGPRVYWHSDRGPDQQGRRRAVPDVHLAGGVPAASANRQRGRAPDSGFSHCVGRANSVTLGRPKALCVRVFHVKHTKERST
jgi:hypothetical protein